jgi:glycoside hydrolase-like protein
VWVGFVDYSFSKPSPAQLAMAGYKAAGAYVGPGTAGKWFTSSEIADLHAHGVSAVLLVEGSEKGAASGATMGAYHGHLAVSHAQTLGAPRGCVLIPAVDWDIQSYDWSAVTGYFQAFRAIASAAGYRTGIYGGLNAVTWAVRDGLVDIVFQTYAWSTRNGVLVWHPRAVIRQTHNNVNAYGGNVDLGMALEPDYGQWTKDGATDMTGSADSTWRFIEDLQRINPANGQRFSPDRWTPPEPVGLPDTGYLQTVNNELGTLLGTVQQDAARARVWAKAILDKLAEGTGNVDVDAIVAAIKADGELTRQALSAHSQAIQAGAEALVTALAVLPSSPPHTDA